MRLTRFADLFLLALAMSCSSSYPRADGEDAGVEADGATSLDASGEGGTVRTLGAVHVLSRDPCGALTAGSACAAQGVTTPTAGFTCASIVVDGCPGVPSSLGACVKVSEAPAPKGSILFFTGTYGTGLYDSTGATVVRSSENNGFRTIQVSWSQPGWDRTGGGTVAEACQPATVIDWAFREPSLQGASRDTGFCATGNSAGSSQVTYAVTHYGLGDELDEIVPSSGPVSARIDWGCDPALCPPGAACSLTPPATPCGNGAATRTIGYAQNAGAVALVNASEGTTTCGAANPPEPNVDAWRGDSVLDSPGATYVFPDTLVHQFLGCKDPSMFPVHGNLFAQRVDPLNGGRASLTWEATAPHELQTDPAAAADLAADLAANCVPRHR